MKKILVVQGGGRPNGNTTQLVNYIGFNDLGTVLAGGCGDTNGKPQIDKTNHLQTAYEFGKNIYSNQ